MDAPIEDGLPINRHQGIVRDAIGDDLGSFIRTSTRRCVKTEILLRSYDEEEAARERYRERLQARVDEKGGQLFLALLALVLLPALGAFLVPLIRDESPKDYIHHWRGSLLFSAYLLIYGLFKECFDKTCKRIGEVWQ